MICAKETESCKHSVFLFPEDNRRTVRRPGFAWSIPNVVIDYQFWQQFCNVLGSKAFDRMAVLMSISHVWKQLWKYLAVMQWWRTVGYTATVVSDWSQYGACNFPVWQKGAVIRVASTLIKGVVSCVEWSASSLKVLVQDALGALGHIEAG